MKIDLSSAWKIYNMYTYNGRGGYKVDGYYTEYSEACARAAWLNGCGGTDGWIIVEVELNPQRKA